MRVLVTVKPQMYRETLALALHKYRPDAEVILAPSDFLNVNVMDFEPDLLVRNDTDGADPEYLNSIACRIEILYSDSMDARINLNGRAWNIGDMSVKDLLAVLDEAEELISQEPTGS